MLDKKVNMMDAGMRLFQTEKPFGTVLGGIKVEMAKYGNVLRPNEIDASNLPPTTGACDLFLDRSNRYKSKYLACSLEDAGTVGSTPDGDPIHRYAVTLKEGNRNTNVGLYVHLALVLIWAMLGWFVSDGNAWIVLLFTAVGLFGAWRMLRPDKGSVKIVEQLLETFANGK
ncbi:MAG: hypothetical protein IK076_08175 [Bacteroidales bacterium]|nr:hypothetical protein [Bacteroidales bacterium]